MTVLSAQSMGRWVLATSLVLAASATVQARELTLDQRVDCRRAVEEVYWRHRTWPTENPTAKPTLGEVLTEDALRAKVEATLRASAALEMWGRPITTSDIQSEMDRIARTSRTPEMMEEILAALDHDPFLVAECLVRPILADQRIGELLDADRAFADWWATEGESVPAQIASRGRRSDGAGRWQSFEACLSGPTPIDRPVSKST